MRALTLTQPWAGLVASGIKLVENRPRLMIKRDDFGKPFAIHASREIDQRVYARIHEIAPELVPYGQTKAAWAALSRITSAVIGTAIVERAVIRYDPRISCLTRTAASHLISASRTGGSSARSDTCSAMSRPCELRCRSRASWVSGRCPPMLRWW